MKKKEKKNLLWKKLFPLHKLFKLKFNLVFMNKLQKTLCIGVGVLALAGCAQQYKTGTVIGEYGSVVTDRLVKSDDALLGGITANETIKLGNSTYILKIRTDDDKIYIASIYPYNDISLESINIAINVGDRIKFPITPGFLSCTDRFNKSRMGALDSDDIELLTEKTN